MKYNALLITYLNKTQHSQQQLSLQGLYRISLFYKVRNTDRIFSTLNNTNHFLCNIYLLLE